MNDDLETEVLRVPPKLADEINDRNVRALRVNAKYAGKKHEDGYSYSMANAVDVATRAWMMYQMHNGSLSPREAVECYMELLVQCILPSFAATPPVAEAIKLEAAQAKNKTDEVPIMGQINDLLKSLGIEPIVCAGTLDEIIEQLQGLRDSEGETRQ